jgi:acyl-CoA thioester hydrolase
VSVAAADLASAYRYWTREQVRFADLDMIGHVNNTVYATYVESGRAAFMQEIGLWTPGVGVQSVVARLEIDYRRELLYRAQLEIGVRVLAIGRSSFRLGCGIFSDGICHATGLSVVVRWNSQTRTSMPLDEPALAKLRPHLSV